MNLKITCLHCPEGLLKFWRHHVAVLEKHRIFLAHFKIENQQFFRFLHVEVVDFEETKQQQFVCKEEMLN